MGNSFICVICCGEFEIDGEKPADPEMTEIFPASEDSDLVTVCEDCYQVLLHQARAIRN